MEVRPQTQPMCKRLVRVGFERKNEDDAPLYCIFCGAVDNHLSKDCLYVVTHGERRHQIYQVQEINEVAICFNCLEIGHYEESCWKPVMCEYCKNLKHHSAFCRHRNGAYCDDPEVIYSLRLRNSAYS